MRQRNRLITGASVFKRTVPVIHNQIYKGIYLMVNKSLKLCGDITGGSKKTINSKGFPGMRLGSRCIFRTHRRNCLVQKSDNRSCCTGLQ